MKNLSTLSQFGKRTSVALILTLLAAFQLASAQGINLGIQPKSFLVLNPAIQKEIKLSPEQLKKINNVFGDTVSTDDQGRIRVQLSGGEDMAQIDKDALKLLDANQLKRLTEIWIQRVGFLVIGSKEIQKALTLDEAQIKKINQETQNFQEELHNLISENNGMITPEIMKPAQDKFKATMKGILTKEQLEKFEALKGVEFKMKP